MSVLTRSIHDAINPQASLGGSTSYVREPSTTAAFDLKLIPSLKGFPTRLDGPGVWNSSDFTASEQYVQQLDEADLRDIDQALRAFQESGKSPNLMRRELFVLGPRLSQKLRQISEIIHNGRFFCVLRGLNPNKYTEMENIIIYGGIASHVGDDRADMIHLYDRAKGDQSEESRTRFPPNEITIPMDFHTDVDAGDVLSLFTLQLPKQGGAQYLASFWSIYNKLAEENPAVLATLASNWRYEMKWQNGVEVVDRPVMTCVGGRVQINFATAFLIGSSYIPRLPDGPSISPAQQTAIDELLRLSRENALALDSAKGDILFANNMALVHARDNFIDDSSTGQVRHLLSVMLRDSEKAWLKDASVANMIDRKFSSLDLPEFFGTVNEYEEFREKFAMLRHD